MMKTGRREFKTKVVTIRMSEGMYRQVSEQATRKYMGVQEYVRYLLARDIDRTSSYLEEP